jgi:hypothetical protein
LKIQQGGRHVLPAESFEPVRFSQRIAAGFEHVRAECVRAGAEIPQSVFGKPFAYDPSIISQLARRQGEQIAELLLRAASRLQKDDSAQRTKCLEILYGVARRRPGSFFNIHISSILDCFEVFYIFAILLQKNCDFMFFAQFGVFISCRDLL